MRLCVLDSSFALAWVFEDETEPAAVRLAERLTAGDSVVVPAVLWSLEIRNALRSAVRRKRISSTRAEQQRRALESVPRVQVPCPHGLGDEVDRLILAHDLTSYDAAYLAVALRHSLPLATLDDALEQAALSEGVVSFRKSARDRR
jgi:predicted nucleic acid-binding protein